MSDVRRPDRPPQVTWGASFAILASALMVISAFEGMATLRSVDTRAELAKLLDSSVLRDRGVTLDQATDVMHGLLLVSGAGAAVVLVLAIFVLRGHVAARVGLTVLAVVVIVCSAATDRGVGDRLVQPFLFAMVLAFAVGLLWSRPARDWYAGRPPQPARPAGPTGPTAESSAEPPGENRPAPGPHGPQGEQAPPPTYGYGSPQARPGQAPLPPPPPPGLPPAGYPPAGYPPPGHRPPPPYGAAPGHSSGHLPGPHPGGTPAPVRTAAILTWAAAGLAIVGFALVGLFLATDRGELFDELERRREYQDLDVTRDQVTVVLGVGLVLLAVWAVVACVLAYFTWRGHNWARITLAVSAGVSAVFCLFAIPVSLLHLVAGAVVVGLLFSPASNQWFRARAVGRMPPPPYPPGGSWGPPPQSPRDPDDKPPVW